MSVQFIDLPLKQTGKALPAWTYREPEFLALEEEAIFRRHWHVVCHHSELKAPGDYVVFDLLNDSVIVMRGKDGELRAMMNACRHRAARLLDGRGNCRTRIQCPYHGWSYDTTGALKAVPREADFPDFDVAGCRLNPVELELFMGFVFIRIDGQGPSVAEMWGPFGPELEPYRIADMELVEVVETEIWDCNWKIAYDNYQESYHVPVGHPALFRMFGAGQSDRALTSGMASGIVTLKDKPSANGFERLYQELATRNNSYLPEPLRRSWNFVSMLPNMGFDIYPEGMDFFQVLPLGVDRTLVRGAVYGLPDVGREERVMRLINKRIARLTNREDKELAEMVQRGLHTAGYTPGPLAVSEHCIEQFHDRIREVIPVAAEERPPKGISLKLANESLLQQAAE